MGAFMLVCGLVLALCMILKKENVLPLLAAVGWVLSSVLAVSGGILLYVWLTGTDAEELKDMYELLGGRIRCRSAGLTRHMCVIRNVKGASKQAELVRVVAEFLAREAGYRVRDLTSTYAVLTRGGLLNRRKSLILLIFVNNDDVVFEYRVAPLQASGLYDLRLAVNEVKLLLTECGRIRAIIAEEPSDDSTNKE